MLHCPVVTLPHVTTSLEDDLVLGLYGKDFLQAECQLIVFFIKGGRVAEEGACIPNRVVGFIDGVHQGDNLAALKAVADGGLTSRVHGCGEVVNV